MEAVEGLSPATDDLACTHLTTAGTRRMKEDHVYHTTCHRWPYGYVINGINPISLMSYVFISD
jgi:hypothetical protein